MADVFVSGILRLLIQKLSSPDFTKDAVGERVRSDLKKLKKKLLRIRRAVRHAERSQVTSERARKWLERRRNVLYDIEDELDLIAADASRGELVIDNQSIIHNLIPSCLNSYAPKLSTRSNMKVISSYTWRKRYGLRHGFGLCMFREKMDKERISVVTRTSHSSKLVALSDVYGRDKDQSKIVDMVLRDNETSNANLHLIAILGTGGLGKTTLAQLVYNNKTVRENFELKAWVCVSEESDVLRISKAILESIAQSSNNLKYLNQVLIQLKDAIAGRKFLLVLDDVWRSNCVFWETLKSVFLGVALGSKILVTTRFKEAATVMGATEYNLEHLPDNICWSLFTKYAALEDGVTSQELDPTLMRQEVLMKCRGLPLAARILGGLLREMPTYTWAYILQNKIWDLSNRTGILPVLRLSYHHLPPHLQHCFAFCAIFPKDYEFDEKELVQLWMAEGLLHSIYDKQLEEIGSKYFHELLSRSFFQQSSINNSKFVMHDLLNDLAQWVSGKMNYRMENELEVPKQPIAYKEVRHFSFTSNNYDGRRKFRILPKTMAMRTFMPIPVGAGARYITHLVLSDTLPKLKKLRVLSLGKYCITDLPDSIDGLKLLRYLNLSGTEIRCLPETTSLLRNLQTLLLRDCFHLKKLPTNMGNLTNLRHLDILHVNLEEMPLGMEKLKNLRTLTNFVVGKGVGSCITVLKNLKYLCGELRISRLENVLDINEGVLRDKKYLEVLLLEWMSEFDDSRDGTEEKNVLQMLLPHENLKELTIKCYGGKTFPSWVGDPSFTNMVAMRLESCENCTSLPALGSLSSLKDLAIKGMKGLKHIGSEIYGEGCLEAFPSLQTLRLEDMQDWEHWEHLEDNDPVKCFHNLQELTILDCPKLSGRLPNGLPSLRKFVIQECPQLVLSIRHFPSLEKLVIHQCQQLTVLFVSLLHLCELELHRCKKMVVSSLLDLRQLKSVTLSNISDFEDGLLTRFQKVENLKIVNCEELIEIWKNETCIEKPPELLHSFTFLKELSIEYCPGLSMLPENRCFTNLSKLAITNCYALKALPKGMKDNDGHLESLLIKGCHSLTSILKGQLPSSLKRVSATNCKKLRCLLHDTEDTLTSTSSSSCKANIKPNTTCFLEKLYVSNCPSLSSIGELPATLKQLDVQDCLELVTLSSSDQLPASLKHLEISGCSELTTLSLSGQLPTALQHLEVTDCPKLRSIADRFSCNMSLDSILIRDCKRLGSIPEGLHDLKRLHRIYILDCPALVSFPQGGLPNTSLKVFSIQRCKMIDVLPNNMHSLNSLRQLVIWECPSIESFPEGGLPANLTSLTIAGLGIRVPSIYWGLQNLTSLKDLEVRGCQDVVNFPQERMSMMLPTSLIKLTIQGFEKLRSLSDGFQKLKSLQNLSISDCPNLKLFPNVGLPDSLLQLYVSNCPLLEKRCQKDRGPEWSKIADIPRVRIGYKFIYDPDEE